MSCGQRMRNGSKNLRAAIALAALFGSTLTGQSQLLTFPGRDTATAFLVSTKPRNDGLELAFPGEPLALLRLGHGQPRWQPAHDRLLDAAGNNRWFRLGQNYWATMDNNRPVVIGDVTVPPGLRNLSWGFGPSGEPALLAMDPDAAHARRAYPPFGDRYPDGIVIPLRHSRAEQSQELLAIDLRAAGDGRGLMLELAWGPHRWWV